MSKRLAFLALALATAGAVLPALAELGLRYALARSVHAELTQKVAYGKLHGVPVDHGLASQVVWMSEQVMSVGVLF